MLVGRGRAGQSRRARSASWPTAATGTPDGDVIQAIDGRRIRSAEDLVHALHARRPGDSITLEFQRGRRAPDVRCALAERPAQLMVD